MTFDLEKVLESKRAMRQQLAARPIAEKLAMLDVLRERALALRAAQHLPAEADDTQKQPLYSAKNTS
jgi:hypothetical protein